MASKDTKLGPYWWLDSETGMQESRSIGDQALHSSAAEGSRIVVKTVGGKHQLDMVPRSVTAEYTSPLQGWMIGGALVASDVTPGGMYNVRNLTGKNLWMDYNTINVTTNPAAACTVEVGISPDPLAAATTFWTALDVRNGGTPKYWDTRVAADGGNSLSAKFDNGSWYSISVIAGGASAGIVGWWSAYVYEAATLDAVVLAS